MDGNSISEWTKVERRLADACGQWPCCEAADAGDKVVAEPLW